MFEVASFTAAAVLVTVVARRRRAAVAVFLAVLFGVNLLVGNVLHARLVAATSTFPIAARIGLSAVYVYGAGAFLASSFAMLAAPRLRGRAWVAGVVVPGAVWLAGTFLAIPWVALSVALGPFLTVPDLGWVWYAIALTGVPTSLVPRREVVRLVVDGADAGRAVRRLPVARRVVSVLPDAPVAEALRIVQITDPHLGPFRSEASLHDLCARAVAANPDLVLVTGDLFTIEGAGSPDALVRALAPLRALRGRVFACSGNHDHEHPEEVAAALRSAGARLLVDEAAVVETRLGAVQIVGLEHRWRSRERHGEVLRAHPRPVGPDGAAALRLVLLHDPGAFRGLPSGEADLVLSGHTHGGHVGLVSLGLDWTAIGALTGMPDHGWWGQGRDRLYVHRASGHYGFPLRVGVPMEESVLEVVRA